jgi:purine-nucleoside phosphorylase
MLGYTGYYHNTKVTVMGHGMGMPSVGIYSYELFKFYKAHTIIRVGSCGGLTKDINLGDVVIVKDAYSESIYARDVGAKVKNHILNSDPMLLTLTLKIANDLKIKYHLGRVLCEDVFYNKYSVSDKIRRSQGAIGVEMEAFALYANAQVNKKHALTLLTCSDSLITHQAMSPMLRQTSFKQMIKLALTLATQIRT